LNDYSNVDEEPWSGVSTLALKDTNAEDPQGGNILIESQSGHVFEISTENYDKNTTELIKELSDLLRKTGVAII
jgi:hypothetical protein